jgi:hypothetical protein
MKIKKNTRLVILIGNIAIKIPLSIKGYLQSKNERYIYSKYKNLGMLGKLYWEFMGIVCMKRYKPIPRILKSYVKGMKMLIPEFDFKNCDLNNPSNWGKEDDYLILIDYGITKDIAKIYK